MLNYGFGTINLFCSADTWNSMTPEDQEIMLEAGRMAYEAGLGAVAENFEADASSPLTAFLDEE